MVLQFRVLSEEESLRGPIAFCMASIHWCWSSFVSAAWTKERERKEEDYLLYLLIRLNILSYHLNLQGIFFYIWVLLLIVPHFFLLPISISSAFPPHHLPLLSSIHIVIFPSSFFTSSSSSSFPILFLAFLILLFSLPPPPPPPPRPHQVDMRKVPACEAEGVVCPHDPGPLGGYFLH